MKKLILLSILCWSLSFSSCATEPEVIYKDREIPREQETPSAISSDRPYVVAAATSSKASFTITSESGWTLMENSADWFTVEPTSSDKGGKVTVTVTMKQNETYVDRSANLLFYSSDNEVEVVFLQAGIPAPDSCCDFSTSENLTFAPEDVTGNDVKITTYNEAVTVSAEGLDTFCKDCPAEIAAGQEYTLSICPPSANVYEKREATVTFTGKESGKTRTLTVEQKNLYKPVHGFPAKWEIEKGAYTTSNTIGKRWLEQGISYAHQDNGAGSAIITAVSSDSNRKLKHSIATSSLALSNLTTDDYIVFCAPVQSVEAGCDFDFCLTLTASSPKAPKYWIFEYYDGGEWKSVEEDLKVVPEDGKTKYSFYTKKISADDSNYTTFVQSFTLQNPVKDDFVRARCRVVSRINSEGTILQPDESANIWFPRWTFMTCYMFCNQGLPAIKDTHKIMALGNSFTYYYATLFMLKEIARREGHQLKIRANLKGSMTIYQHLYELELSKGVVDEGGYDFAFMQGSSYNSSAAFWAAGCPEDFPRLADIRNLSSNIRKASPSAKIVFENTWTYTKENYKGYGSYQTFFEHLYNGSIAIRDMSPEIDWISPIGVAFKKATEEGFDLLYTDGHHQNRNGAYLKACVNYLMMFGEKFGNDPAVCSLDAATAKRLREIAEETVLGNESIYKTKNPR